MSDQFLEIGTTVAIQKAELDHLFARLVKMGYEVIGPKAKDHTIVHAPLKTASELPLGFSSIQEPGKFQLVQSGHLNYFDVTNGPHSWKEYFFPSKSELMRFHKDNWKSWNVEEAVNEVPHYAMVGVRPCDLAAIEIQDKVFIREA
jgi:sulfhydrogenase subunit beta (sulfur reductase)